jgi:uncharacterized protein (DUF1684 family)
VDELELLDWKRRVSELYTAARAASDPRDGWELWRRGRAELFASHSQSPVPEAVRGAYDGPHVFEYDPAWRLLAEVVPAERHEFELPASDGNTMVFARFAFARVEDIDLELYWLEGYGGGVFLPFADATSGTETYGAGRYLLDTVKGADLGSEGDRLVLDFNFAYQPSCSYDPRWLCPLAPRANRISLPVPVGERLVAERATA